MAIITIMNEQNHDWYKYSAVLQTLGTFFSGVSSLRNAKTCCGAMRYSVTVGASVLFSHIVTAPLTVVRRGGCRANRLDVLLIIAVCRSLLESAQSSCNPTLPLSVSRFDFAFPLSRRCGRGLYRERSVCLYTGRRPEVDLFKAINTDIRCRLRWPPQ